MLALFLPVSAWAAAYQAGTRVWCESIVLRQIPSTSGFPKLQFDTNPELFTDLNFSAPYPELGFGGDARGLLRAWFRYQWEFSPPIAGVAMIQIPEVDLNNNGVPDLYDLETEFRVTDTERSQLFFFPVVQDYPTNYFRPEFTRITWDRTAGAAKGRMSLGFRFDPQPPPEFPGAAPDPAFGQDLEFEFEVFEMRGTFDYDINRATGQAIGNIVWLQGGLPPARASMTSGAPTVVRLRAVEPNQLSWEPWLLDSDVPVVPIQVLPSWETSPLPMRLRRESAAGRFQGQFFVARLRDAALRAEQFDFWSWQLDLPAVPPVVLNGSVIDLRLTRGANGLLLRASLDPNFAHLPLVLEDSLDLLHWQAIPGATTEYPVTPSTNPRFFRAVLEGVASGSPAVK